MAEDSGQASGAGQPQAGEGGAQNGAAQGGEGASQADAQRVFDAEYVGRLRAENAAHRTKLRELEEKVKTFETERLSEAEKLQKRAEEAEKRAQEAERRVRERTIRAEVRLAAVAAGIVDPEAAYRLLDLDQVALNDDGEPTNIDKLVAQLLKDKPYLGGRSAQSGPAGNPGSGRPAVLTMDEIRRMTPEQINANWAAVQQAMRGDQRG